MRRIVWAALLLGAYFWVVSTGRQGLLLEKATALYEQVVSWLDEADVDYQLKKPKSKKARRWD